jgi:hypothetical protein
MRDECNPWLEERHFRRDAINGSAMLRDAVLKHLGVADSMPEGAEPKSKARYIPKAQRTRRRGRPPEPFRINPDIERIKQAVARHFRIDPIWMVDHNSSWSVARPRMIAMYVARTVVGASFPVIGKHFGKDHTTVLHACRAVEKRANLMDAAAIIASSLTLKTQDERLAA